MKKKVRILLSVLGILFLLGSFPLQNLLGGSVLPGVCRIIGYVLALAVIILRAKDRKE